MPPRIFLFTDDHGRSAERDDEGAVEIQVEESLNEAYGLYIWPSSIALADYLWKMREEIQGKNILELGAGTGLPGILAAKLGARVSLTDMEEGVGVLRNLRVSCEQNKVTCEVFGLNWGQEPAKIQDRYDIIIGADVLYESDCFDALFATVHYFLQTAAKKYNAKATFITCYHHRSHHKSIEHLLKAFNLRVVNLVPASSFMSSERHKNLNTESIQLVEIQLHALS